MKKSFGSAALFCIVTLAFRSICSFAVPNPKIYIAPQNGYESYLAGGIHKKERASADGPN